MNYYPNRDGNIPELDSDELTSSELTARHLDRSRVVKSFNTMRSADLGEGGKPDADFDERLAMYIAGDDEDANMSVAGLIDQFGFAPLDVGNLRIRRASAAAGLAGLRRVPDPGRREGSAGMAVSCGHLDTIDTRSSPSRSRAARTASRSARAGCTCACAPTAATSAAVTPRPTATPRPTPRRPATR